MIGIYTKPRPDCLISSGTDTNPYRVVVDASKTTAVEKKLYIRNDDIRRWYSAISLEVLDKGGDIFADITKGFSWKLFLGDLRPTQGQWMTISPTGGIGFPNLGSSTLGDIGQYYSFWLRTEVPRGHMAQVVRSVIFRLCYEEWMVS